MLTFLSTARLQEFGNDGRALAGGFIESYYLGTSSPKPLYQDINGEAIHPNPLFLDAYGSAEIYLFGSYTLVLKDSTSATLSTVDIAGGINDFITSGGSGSFADNIVISVNNYASVRALTNPYGWVFVQGRETQADGGQGLFYYDSTNSSQDDDGITLQPSITGRYVRYDVSEISPTWFGLQYNDSSSQATYLTQAETASIRYARPILINGSTYINSNYTTTSGAQYIFSNTAKLVSTLSVTMTFITGTKILSCGRRVFGNTVQPIFQKSVWPNDLINYSIMDADNIEGRIAKLEDCSSENYFVRFDESISTSVAPQLPANFDLSYSGQVVTITASSPLSYRTSYDGVGQMFAYNLLASVGSVSVTGTIKPENFGQDNNIAFKVLSKVGRGNLQPGATYEIIENVINGFDISFTCDSNISASNIRLSASTSGTEFINCDRLYLENVLLRLDNTIANIDTLVGKECILSASQDNAILCDAADLTDSYLYREAILSTPTSAVYFSNVQLFDEPTKRFYKNDTTFDSVYLRTLSKTDEYTTLLGIDSNDKVITIDNLVLPSVSATSATFENTPVTRKLNPTRIDFRWNYNSVAGFGECSIYRDNVLVLTTSPNPLTATYTTTSADGSVIICSTIGSTYAQQVCRINLTSGSGLASTKQQVAILQDASIITFQVGGDVTALYQIPNLTEQSKYATNAWHDSRTGKWILS